MSDTTPTRFFSPPARVLLCLMLTEYSSAELSNVIVNCDISDNVDIIGMGNYKCSACHVILLTTRTSHTPTNIVTTQGSQVDTLHVQDDYQQISIYWREIISQGIF